MSEKRSEMSAEEIHALLRFYDESGLDFPIADEATNRFQDLSTSQAKQPIGGGEEAVAPAQGRPVSDTHVDDMIEMDPRKRQENEPKPIAKPTSSLTVPTEEVVAEAFKLATSAKDLDALRASVEAFEGCNLKRSARSTVFEGGNRSASIMLIAGCPSKDDDVSGSAFSGADGLLLEKMLGAISLSRLDDVYYGFCVPWSPPGGSAPTPLHLDICAPFLARQIELAAPKLVVVLGNVAARHVFQSRQTVVQLRGKWTTLPNFGVEAMAMFDPTMLRAQPRMKRTAWLDLLELNSKLNSL